MAQALTWMSVKGRSGSKVIGAVAFVGDDPAVVVGFYDEHDANKDGRVSWGERAAAALLPVSLAGSSSLDVVSRAREQATLQVANNVPGAEAKAKSLRRLQGAQFQAVGLNMALDGIFKVYVGAHLGRLGGAIGNHVGAGTIKTVLIKKGMEKLAKEAFDAAAKPH